MKYLKRVILVLIVFFILVGITLFSLIAWYKKDLKGILETQFKQRYGLELKTAKVSISLFSNWPHASVQLKDVSLADTIVTNTQAPLFEARVVSLSFNIRKLLQKKFEVNYITIKDAQVLIERYNDGTLNFPLSKFTNEDTAANSDVLFDIKKCSVKNTRCHYRNDVLNQDIDFTLADNTLRLKGSVDGLNANLNGVIHIEKLLLNPKGGAFMRNVNMEADFCAVYFKQDKSWMIKPNSIARIQKQNYEITALLERDSISVLSLNIKNEKLHINKAKPLLTDKISKMLASFNISSDISASLFMKVRLGKREEPIVIVRFKANHSDLTIGVSKVPYAGLSFNGRLVSMNKERTCGDMKNAFIIAEQVSGKIYDFPFNSTVTVTRLTDPFIRIKASLNIDAEKVNSNFENDFNLRGKARADILYSGLTRHLNKEEFLERNVILSARLYLDNITFRHIDDRYGYSVSGLAKVNNRDVIFNQMKLNTVMGDLVISGRTENFVRYLLGYSKVFKATVNGTSSKLDLNPLLTKGDDEGKVPEGRTKKGNKKITQSVFDIYASVAAKHMTIRKVEAEEARLFMHYTNNLLTVEKLDLNSCGGQILAKGHIKDFSTIKANVDIQNVDVNMLFNQFENFGQQAISDKNLNGRVSVSADIAAQLNENFLIRGEETRGEVKLKLVDGHLINFEPVQSLSNFLFRNRDFNDVAFSELNEHFTVNGYVINIRELEIRSSILDLYVVNGIYDIKGQTNINVLVPWSNLKRRGKNYIPKNTGESASDTKGVKLNFYGPSKKLKISIGHKPL